MTITFRGSAPSSSPGNGIPVNEISAIETDLVAAIEYGCDLDAYVLARDAGASHQEALEGHALLEAHYYADARRVGLDHQGVHDLVDQCVNICHYVQHRRAGAEHEEALEALADCLLAPTYQFLRKDGRNHAQAMAAWNQHCTGAVGAIAVRPAR